MLELFTLCGFVVAQPVFSIFGHAPEEFVFRRIDRFGVLLFAFVVVIAPPVLLWCVGALAAWAGRSIGMVAHDILMGALWMMLGVEVLQRVDILPVLPILLGGVAVAATAIVLSITSRWFMQWITFASPAPLVFGVMFLLFSPVADQVRSSDNLPGMSVAVGNPAPVVMLVLDEFPLASVVDGDGQLEKDLYPNLATLQRQSNTYLNATSNAWATTLSVPSLLTGRLPEGDRLPVAASQPRNLFTLLGKSHELRVHELLSMCPTSLCPRKDSGGLIPRGFGKLMLSATFTFQDAVDPRPDSQSRNGAAFGEAIDAMVKASGGPRVKGEGDELFLPARFSEFLDDLGRPVGKRPPFAFLHLLVPHAPWILLPDGRSYIRSGEGAEVMGLTDDIWGNSRALTSLARQRHILQVQYADRLVGELMRRMKASGLWNRAAVIITADHGVSFEPGQGRRDVTRKNVGEIAWVPLFIKSPGQQIGHDNFKPVQLVDVLPTLADILRIDLPWRVPGQSMLSSTRRPEKRSMLIGGGQRLDVDRGTGRDQMLARSVDVFAPRRGDPWRVYRVGSQASLVGRQVDAFAHQKSPGGEAVLDRRGVWANVSTTSSELPTYVRATISGLRPTSSSVAIAVNGVVAAFADVSDGSPDTEVAALVPPSLLRDGRNQIRLYAVDKSMRLSPLVIH